MCHYSLLSLPSFPVLSIYLPSLFLACLFSITFSCIVSFLFPSSFLFRLFDLSLGFSSFGDQMQFISELNLDYLKSKSDFCLSPFYSICNFFFLCFLVLFPISVFTLHSYFVFHFFPFFSFLDHHGMLS